MNLKRKILLHQNTPLEVIEYLLKTLGKNIKKNKIENTIEKIKKFYENYENTIELDKEYDNSDYEKISTYVSSTEENWEAGILKESFENLLNFEKYFNFENISFGIRTNDNPYNFDIIMLYQICILLKISTKREDTFCTLQEKFLDRNLTRNGIINSVKNNIFNLSDYKLLNISKFISDDFSAFKYNEDDLKFLSSKINISYIINRSLLSKNDAIVYAAKFFSIDITDSINPILILNKLINSEYDFDFDDTFSKNYRLNNEYYKLEKFWRKKISYLYTPKLMNNLKKYEFILETDESCELDKKLDEKNFYYGRIPEIHDFSIDKDIISYGIINNKDLEILNLEKTNDYFRKNNSFGKYNQNINKLLGLCKELNGEIYQNLFDTIDYIKKYCLIIDDNIEKIINKANILPLFKKLYDLSLLLSEKDSIDDLENLSILNSSEEILKDINNLDDNISVKNLIIVNYKNSKFIKARENYYPTIYEDLKSLINLKEKSKDYIKNKSEYYKYSSYYYCYMINKEKLFDLGD